MDKSPAPHAVLPDRLLDKNTVNNMRVGQTAYIVPWGMWVDGTRRCWLHPWYNIHPRAEGTATMRIERREDGFHVWPPRGETWQPTETPGYVSPADTPYIPIVKLNG